MSSSPCPPDSVPTSITPAILDTVLGHLAPHFLTSTKGDLPTARHAASHMLAAYGLETEEELRLAAAIVSFSFHALEALSEAAPPDLSIEAKLSLRAIAVSLSREAHKSQRKLDQLQRARRTAPPAGLAAPTPHPGAHPPPTHSPPTQAPHRHSPTTQAPPTQAPEISAPPPPSPPAATPDQPASPPLGLIEPAREAIRTGANATGAKAWSQSRQQRRAAERIAGNLYRNHTAQDRPTASATPAPAENEPRRAAV